MESEEQIQNGICKNPLSLVFQSSSIIPWLVVRLLTHSSFFFSFSVSFLSSCFFNSLTVSQSLQIFCQSNFFSPLFYFHIPDFISLCLHPILPKFLTNNRSWEGCVEWRTFGNFFSLLRTWWSIKDTWQRLKKGQRWSGLRQRQLNRGCWRGRHLDK